ncbi:DUF86 domain-containing protein [Candidatus Woesearchaeota archaeon]|nr:DUF86 domain-containing protein [Candidatus Woesearchaeota archaeon]
MQRKYDIYLKEILQAIKFIEDITSNLEEEDFYSNQTVIAAVMWNLTIIGEAISQLPNEFKQKYNH